MSPEARVEIERRLQINLGPQVESPSARRMRTLGLLASLLQGRSPLPGWSFSTVTQAEYEAARTPDAPSAGWLAREFGSWILACRAAYANRPGWKRGDPTTWPSVIRGAPRRAPYTRDEVVRALQQCARELGFTPSSSTFGRWSANKRAQARRLGRPARVAGFRQLYRYFPAEAGGFNAALAAAGLSAP